MNIKKGITFDKFVEVVSDASKCLSGLNGDLSDDNKKALREVYNYIKAKWGHVSLKDASLVGQTMLAQNVDYEW